MSEKIGIYTIYDEKSERYDTPFFALNDIHAKRRFIQLCQKDDTMLKTFKQDFKLFEIGTFDVLTSEISINHRLLLSGSQIEGVK